MSATKSDVALRDELKAFVYAEAELLDDGKFDDWLDLFADDGIYWIPAVPNQDDPLNTILIFYED
jgi:3-phenylpropionate/cinnamic acid dioxygenase small subunit